MIELSERDQTIYEYLRQYHANANGAPAPSYREIVAGCHLTSTRLVKRSLINLSDAGLISWYPKMARSIRVIENGAASE